MRLDQNAEKNIGRLESYSIVDIQFGSRKLKQGVVVQAQPQIDLQEIFPKFGVS